MLAMTDNLLQKIEERVLALLNELEVMRSEIIKLRSENAILRDDHGTHVEKLQGLISLLDVLDCSDSQKYVVSARDAVAIA
jgi:hypothetical protein